MLCSRLGQQLGSYGSPRKAFHLIPYHMEISLCPRTELSSSAVSTACMTTCSAITNCASSTIHPDRLWKLYVSNLVVELRLSNLVVELFSCCIASKWSTNCVHRTHLHQLLLYESFLWLVRHLWTYLVWYPICFHAWHLSSCLTSLFSCQTLSAWLSCLTSLCVSCICLTLYLYIIN